MYPQPDDAHAAYPDNGAQLPAHHLPYAYDRRPAGTADAYQAYHYSAPARVHLAGIDRALVMHTVKSIDGFAPPPPYPSLSAPGPSSEHSGDSDAWPDAAHPTTAAAVHDMYKPKKPRRDKPRIALAPGQPPTTQGKPRARVYVACQQWYMLFAPLLGLCCSSVICLAARARSAATAQSPPATTARGARTRARTAATTTRCRSAAGPTKRLAHANAWRATCATLSRRYPAGGGGPLAATPPK